MKKLRILTTLAILLTGLFAGSAKPVLATGDCGTAALILYDGLNRTGASRQYCYGVNDTDFSSESGLVMGPLYNGSYLNDFNDSSSSHSGVNSAYYIELGSTSIRACIYNGSSYTGGLMASLTTSGQSWNFNDPAGFASSFKFTTISCPA